MTKVFAGIRKAIKLTSRFCRLDDKIFMLHTLVMLLQQASGMCIQSAPKPQCAQLTNY